MLFFFMYLVIYGMMNAYVLHKFVAAFGGGRGCFLLGACTIGLILFLPLVLHRFDDQLPQSGLRVLSLATFCWMGAVFWFDCAFLFFDVWRLGTVLGRTGGSVGIWLPTGAQQVGWAVAFIAGAATWGYFEAGAVRLRTVTVLSDKLNVGAPPIRLVQIADLHVGRTSRQDITEVVFARIAEASPDILVSTGDLIDGLGSETDETMARFGALQPPLGKFAVCGNHEAYPGLAGTLKCHRDAGFTVLRNETREVSPHVRIAGVDDPALAEIRKDPKVDEAAVLRSVGAGAFTVLLKHRPHVTEAARERCDLQLSGHTHQGQLFPFSAIVRLLY
ncbi:MAG: hypothetical protein HON70_23110, partial [Lentisphaerae bacterium]|nr:hypothetical protein [Lentisphaerota bacterium]